VLRISGAGDVGWRVKPRDGGLYSPGGSLRNPVLVAILESAYADFGGSFTTISIMFCCLVERDMIGVDISSNGRAIKVEGEADRDIRAVV
jgi:hypothetical protein